MMQIMFSLTEYAEEVLIFLCGFIIVLLVVILHRIGNLAKMIRENSVDVRKGQASIEKSQSEKAILTTAEMEALLGEETYTRKQSEKLSMQPEELLAEVLDEVFL